MGGAELALRENFCRIVRLPAGKAQLKLVAELVSSTMTSPPACLLGLLRVQALVYDLFAEFLARLPDDTMQMLVRFQRVAESVQPALDFIERNLGGAIFNRELAKACHLSVNHFLRLFRASMGDTPRNYINERRIRQASQDLVFTRASIETIAARAGFSDRYYFTRVFRRLMGIALATYRRSKITAV